MRIERAPSKVSYVNDKPEIPQNAEPTQPLQSQQPAQPAQQPAQQQPPQTQQAPPQQTPPAYAPPQPPTAPQVQAPQVQQPGAPQYAAPQYGAPQQAAPQYGASVPPPAKKGLPTGAIIGIIAGAVVLLLLIAGGIFAVMNMNRGGGGGIIPESKSSPEAAVEQYLTALSKGDATTARGLLASPNNDSLLTDEVLAKSNELAPITDIAVDSESVTESDYEATVPVTFQIGDTPVSRDFKVYDYGDDWQIGDGTFRLSIAQFKGIEPLVNGVETSDEYPEVFVGTYQFGFGLEQFQLEGDTDTFTLASPGDDESMYSLKATLSEEATAQFREMVRASLGECLGSTALTTPCGMNVDGDFMSGETAVDGTVVRTLTAEGDAALNNLQVQTDYEQPTVALSRDSIRVDITATLTTADGQTGEAKVFGGSTGVATPKVNFAEENPKVVWE